VEVRSKDEIGSFENFRDSLPNHIPEAILEPGNVSAKYITLNDEKMEFTFPDRRILNDEVIDLSQYKLFEGPYLNAEVGSQKLTLTYKDEKLVLDFEKLEKSEK